MGYLDTYRGMAADRSKVGTWKLKPVRRSSSSSSSSSSPLVVSVGGAKLAGEGVEATVHHRRRQQQQQQQQHCGAGLPAQVEERCAKCGYQRWAKRSYGCDKGDKSDAARGGDNCYYKTKDEDGHG
ncbi:hypothetical protein TYRP_007146 [Tyrophagus putrescentiae]|nr:hypothetical protein TYRP_007146 [Tyrophagus putrescentiae]